MAEHERLTLTDGYGLPVTTRSCEALTWYDRGIRGLLGFRKETADCFLKALEIDPDFNMAHCHLGVHYFLEESDAMVERARACYAKAQVGLDALTERERDVVETLTAWGRWQCARGHPAHACRA